MTEHAAINYQVSIRGRGISRLTHDAQSEMIDRYLQGDEPPKGVKIRIQVWKLGRELDWKDDNPRAATLRQTLRRLLQEKRIPLALRRR